MRRGPIVLAPIAALIILAGSVPATAEVTEEFFEGGDASAGWVAFSPGPPGAQEDASIALTVDAEHGTDYDDFAGANLVGVTALPATPPSFWFRSTVSDAGSGGSPRITFVFGNDGVADLRPLSWTADVWTLLDGSEPATWDVRGSCGFIYNATYAQVEACESGSGVAEALLVNDSGWFHPGGYTHYVDDVTIGDDTLSYPSACVDDFTGSHETGPLSSPVHDAGEPAAASAGLEDAVHEVNCDLVVGVVNL